MAQHWTERAHSLTHSLNNLELNSGDAVDALDKIELGTTEPKKPNELIGRLVVKWRIEFMRGGTSLKPNVGNAFRSHRTASFAVGRSENGNSPENRCIDFD